MGKEIEKKMGEKNWEKWKKTKRESRVLHLLKSNPCTWWAQAA